MPSLEAENELRAFFESHLNPLLEKDGGSAEIIKLDGDTIHLRVDGAAAYGVGAHYVRTRIIAPAIRTILPSCTVEFELVAAKPRLSIRPKTDDNAE